MHLLILLLIDVAAIFECLTLSAAAVCGVAFCDSVAASTKEPRKKLSDWHDLLCW